MQITPTNGFIQVKAIEPKKKESIIIVETEDKTVEYEIVSVLKEDTVFKVGQRIMLDPYLLQQVGEYLFIKREAVYGIIT